MIFNNLLFDEEKKGHAPCGESTDIISNRAECLQYVKSMSLHTRSETTEPTVCGLVAVSPIDD